MHFSIRCLAIIFPGYKSPSTSDAGYFIMRCCKICHYQAEIDGEHVPRIFDFVFLPPSLNAATVNEVSTKFQNLTVSKYCSLVASDSEWAAKHRNLTLKSHEYVFWTSTPPRKLIPLPTRLQPRRTACKVSLLLHDDNVYWIFASSKDSNEAGVNVSVHVPVYITE
jgi:hypothetical protein